MREHLYNFSVLSPSILHPSVTMVAASAGVFGLNFLFYKNFDNLTLTQFKCSEMNLFIRESISIDYFSIRSSDATYS